MPPQRPSIIRTRTPPQSPPPQGRTASNRRRRDGTTDTHRAIVTARTTTRTTAIRSTIDAIAIAKCTNAIVRGHPRLPRRRAAIVRRAIAQMRRPITSRAISIDVRVIANWPRGRVDIDRDRANDPRRHRRSESNDDRRGQDRRAVAHNKGIEREHDEAKRANMNRIALERFKLHLYIYLVIKSRFLSTYKTHTFHIHIKRYKHHQHNTHKRILDCY